VVGKSDDGIETSYLAKGILSFSRHFSEDLTSDVNFAPSLRMVTVSNEDGKGAAIADYTDVAIRIAVDSSTDASADLDMGTYRYTLQDKVYFGADSIEEWQYKQITSALYVGNAPRSGSSLPAMILCLETLACDDESITLGAQYFTNTCTATDGADCKDFMQVVFDFGWGGNYDNSDTPEPSSDSRYPALNEAVQLTGVWPSGDTQGADDFAIPSP